jgi:hypothetical protein
VKKNGALSAVYTYDADGRWLGLWDSESGFLAHVYSGLDVVCEVPSSGLGDCTKHFYANGLHVAEDGDGTWEYYHQDHLRSTRLKTDGDVVYGSNYAP